MGDDRPLRLWIAAGSGLLAGVALPPLGQPPLLWLSLALLWSLTQPAGSGVPADAPAAGPRGVSTASPARVTPVSLAGFLWGTAAVLVSHRWLLALHPLDWIGVPGPLSLPICLLIWGCCALLGGLLVALWLALMARLDPLRPSTVLIGAALWGLGEVTLARGPAFWIGLGSAAVPGDPPLAALAAWIGAGGLAALQLGIGWGLWRLLRTVLARPAAGAGRSGVVPGLALLLALVLLPHLAGAASLARAPERGAEERLLVLQPAIPTREKFSVRQQLALLRQLSSALESNPEAKGTLLLPEGSLALGQPLPVAGSLEVLSGGFRQEGEQQRSAVLRFAPGSPLPSQWVDKHRLVPLGEWVPGAALWRWSGLSAVGGLQPGSPSRLLPRPQGGVGVAICYELADGRALAQATRDGALWLLASANLDPYPAMLRQQFTALARLRAIESGRWLVSAANTGPSLLVDPSGRVQVALEPGRPLLGGMRIQRTRALTPYVRWGEGPLGLLLLVGLLLRLSAGGARWIVMSRRPNIDG